MSNEKDIWKQLTREQKREFRRDLAEHFRLRMNLNEAVVKWLSEELGRSPTMKEVAEVRDRFMRALETLIRRRLKKDRPTVAPESRELEKELTPAEYERVKARSLTKLGEICERMLLEDLEEKSKRPLPPNVISFLEYMAKKES